MRTRPPTPMLSFAAAVVLSTAMLAACSSESSEPEPEPLVPATTSTTAEVEEPAAAELPAEMPATVEPSSDDNTGEAEETQNEHTHEDGTTHTH